MMGEQRRRFAGARRSVKDCDDILADLVQESALQLVGVEHCGHAVQLCPLGVQRNRLEDDPWAVLMLLLGGYHIAGAQYPDRRRRVRDGEVRVPDGLSQFVRGNPGGTFGRLDVEPRLFQTHVVMNQAGRSQGKEHRDTHADPVRGARVL